MTRNPILPIPRKLVDSTAIASHAHVMPFLRGLRDRGHEAFLVGGGVRDLLLERRVTDWDLATSALPEQVIEIWPHAVPTGLRHGTVSLFEEGGAIEITTYRTEGPYSDGRRPDWVRLDASLDEDLSRRDFTVNAMALDPLENRLFDPQEGLEDLSRKLLRTVGSPDARFAEDGLRPLRGIRLAAVLEFSIEAETLEAMGRAREAVAGVAAERVREELMKLLLASRPSMGIELLRATGLMEVVLPEMLEGVGMEQNRYHAYDVYEHSLRALDSAPAGNPLVRLAALLHDVGKPRTKKVVDGEGTFYNHQAVGADLTRKMLDRLRFSRADRDHVAHLVREHMFHYTPDWSDGAVRRFLKRVGPEAVDDLFSLRRADDEAHGTGPRSPENLQELGLRVAGVRQRDEVLKVTDLAVDGNDVMRELGFPPGPGVGDVLEGLLERVLEDPTLNRRDRLLDLAREIARSS